MRESKQAGREIINFALGRYYFPSCFSQMRLFSRNRQEKLTLRAGFSSSSSLQNPDQPALPASKVADKWFDIKVHVEAPKKKTAKEKGRTNIVYYKGIAVLEQNKRPVSRSVKSPPNNDTIAEKKSVGPLPQEPTPLTKKRRPPPTPF